MGRPREYTERRVATALRLPESLHEDLTEAARDHGLSVNRMVEQAIVEFLTDLLPPSQVLVTRSDPGES
jgi:predicted HicB family RNase H-like nuclease